MSCFNGFAAQECLGCVSRERCDEETQFLARLSPAERERFVLVRQATLGAQLEKVSAHLRLLVSDFRRGLHDPCVICWLSIYCWLAFILIALYS